MLKEISDMLHWKGETAAAFPIGAFADGPAPSVGDVFGLVGARLRFARNAEIVSEGEPADYVYKVADGAVRTCKLMSDGRRHIGAFYLPGDVFGLEAGEAHGFSAEAVTACGIVLVRRSALLAASARDSQMAEGLLMQTAAHLQRAHSHMLLLARKNAQERVADFLLEMSARLPHASSLELPMGRQDIADYLGLTIETVSRTLTALERDGIIGIPASRRIVLRNRTALEGMNDQIAA
jgi:CRP/FNR family nitrogen fixation transcriptional regulator